MAYPTITNPIIECNATNQVAVIDMVAAIAALGVNLTDTIVEIESEITDVTTDSTNLASQIQSLEAAFSNLTSIPAGGIIAYSGTISAIPVGWALCNGANGTPNLIGKFIYGTNVQGNIKRTGGSANAVNISHNHSTPVHTHTGSTGSAGAHTHSYLYPRVRSGDYDGGGDPSYIWGTSSTLTNSAGAHSHTVSVSASGVSVNSSGVSGMNKNLPPYMQLAYIMKT